MQEPPRRSRTRAQRSPGGGPARHRHDRQGTTGPIKTKWGLEFRRYDECVRYIRQSNSIKAPPGGVALPLPYTVYERRATAAGSNPSRPSAARQVIPEAAVRSLSRERPLRRERDRPNVRDGRVSATDSRLVDVGLGSARRGG
jgi:hypothetical protein